MRIDISSTFLSSLIVTVAYAAMTAQTGGEAALRPCSGDVTVRNAHRLIYDDDRRRIVLFGGADASTVLGDLWEWDQGKWRCLTDAKVLARTFPAMAYDSKRKRIVMFGGNRVLFGSGNETDAILGDTWEWDGTSWKSFRKPGPPARAQAAMVYDSRRQRIVLFGGYYKDGGKTNRLGDTWEFDGRTWRQIMVAGPSPRSGAAMAFDPIRNRTVLFGGSGRANDTWEFDGKVWRRIEAGEVEGRFNAVMAFELQNRRIIRFGGWNGTQRSGDTWELIDQKWRSIDAQGPSGRNHAAMVYDLSRKRVVLFGGHDGENIFGDLWEWDGSRWLGRRSYSPQRRVENDH